VLVSVRWFGLVSYLCVGLSHHCCFAPASGTACMGDCAQVNHLSIYSYLSRVGRSSTNLPAQGYGMACPLCDTIWQVMSDGSDMGFS